MILLESHSQKPDNGIDGSYGFGCADYGPGQRFNVDWGFVLHESIIRYPLMKSKQKMTCNSKRGYV